MKKLFLLASKVIFINKKRGAIPFIISILGIAFLVSSLIFIEGGKKLIRTSPTVIGDNRIIVKGKFFTEKDLKLLENYPFVDYAVFPKAQVLVNGNLYIGYPEKIFSVLGLPVPRENEVLIDKAQFKNIEKNQVIDLEVGNYSKTFTVKDLYRERNPFELRKEGKRVLMLQKTFENIFEKKSFDEMIIVFNRKELVNSYIPMILEKFQEDRGLYGDVEIIKAPEVYGKTERNQDIASGVTGVLAIILIIVGGIGINNIVKYNILSKKEFDKIKSINGINSKNFIPVLICEVILILIAVILIGILLGVLLSNILSDIYCFYPAFKFKTIFFSLLLVFILGVSSGRYTILKSKKG